jgi:histidinol dehydrogenase
MLIVKSSNARAVAALLDKRPAGTPAVQRRVAAIVARVRRDGDRALLTYARTFDGLDGPIEVSRREIDKSATLVDSHVKKAIALAARNIRTVAEKQRPRAWSVSPVPGVRIRQRVQISGRKTNSRLYLPKQIPCYWKNGMQTSHLHRQ